MIVTHAGIISAHAEAFDGSYGHILAMGRHYDGTTTSRPFMTAQEAWSIDTKFDDGKPVSGIVYSRKSTSVFMPGCTTAADATALYAISSTGNLCGFYSRTGF